MKRSIEYNFLKGNKFTGLYDGELLGWVGEPLDYWFIGKMRKAFFISVSTVILTLPGPK